MGGGGTFHADGCMVQSEARRYSLFQAWSSEAETLVYPFHFAFCEKPFMRPSAGSGVGICNLSLHKT
jgi:hypothetical protein